MLDRLINQHAELNAKGEWTLVRGGTRFDEHHNLPYVPLIPATSSPKLTSATPHSSSLPTSVSTLHLSTAAVQCPSVPSLIRSASTPMLTSVNESIDIIDNDSDEEWTLDYVDAEKVSNVLLGDEAEVIIENVVNIPSQFIPQQQPSSLISPSSIPTVASSASSIVNPSTVHVHPLQRPNISPAISSVDRSSTKRTRE